MEEKQTGRRFSKEFKIDAVELALRSDKSIVEIAEELAVLNCCIAGRASIRHNGKHRFPAAAISRILKPKRVESLNENSSLSKRSVIF